MGKAIPKDEFAKRGDETNLEWQMRRARMKADARNPEQPIVSPEAARHGKYERDFVTHVESGTKALTARNRGGDAIERWKDRGKLTQPQIAAIDLCRHLWRLTSTPARVTANYGERIIGSGNAEYRALNEIEARADLHRIQDYFPHAYWCVWENIVRHEMPIGEAASTAGYVGSGAEIRAHTVVCFVGDYIAMRERL